MDHPHRKSPRRLAEQDNVLANGPAIDSDRRNLLAIAAMAGIAVPFGAWAGAPAVTLPWTALAEVDTGDLRICYAEMGPRAGLPTILLHGWPYDITAFAEVAPLLVAAGHRVVIPYLRGFGGTRFLSDASARNGQQAALAADVIALMDALAIPRAVIGGFDWGARSANVVAALWPERCRAMVSVSGYLIGSQHANESPLTPEAEQRWWYQYYFATERGRLGYERYRAQFAELIWRTASPRWAFDEASFRRTAVALDNPDHVAITIHNYRWRLGLAAGENRYDPLEQALATMPAIRVPSVTMEGDANGAPHPDPLSYASKFVGRYVHRSISGGIGHNLPQEAPKAFAEAILEAASMS
ncbi:alpha/beta fold hydrolase [Sphingopyxis chilensis]